MHGFGSTADKMTHSKNLTRSGNLKEALALS